MLETIVNRFKDFRDQIYHFFSLRRDASFELIDSLSGNTKATRKPNEPVMLWSSKTKWPTLRLF